MKKYKIRLTALLMLIIFFITSASGLFQCVSAADTDIIQNGDFEKGAGVGWQAYQGFDIISSEAHSGKNCAVVKAGGGGGGGQAIKLDPNTTYTLSVWGKHSAAASSITTVIISYQNGNVSTEKRAHEIDFKYESIYTLKQLTFTTDSVVKNTQIVVWKLDDKVSFYIDDVTLTKGYRAGDLYSGVNNVLQKDSTQTTVKNIGLMPNGHFEDGLNGWRNCENFKVDAQCPKSGMNAAVISDSGPGRGVQYLRIIKDSLATQILKPNTTYTLSAWAKLSKPAKEPASIYVNYKDPTGKIVTQALTYTSELTYTNKKITFTTPGYLTDGEVGIWKPNEDYSIYVDDVILVAGNELKDEDTTMALPVYMDRSGEIRQKGEVVLNGGFENGLDPWADGGDSSIGKKQGLKDSQALVINPDHSGDRNIGGFCAQQIQIKPFTKYILSATAKTDKSPRLPSVICVSILMAGKMTDKKLEFQNEKEYTKKIINFETNDQMTDAWIRIIKHDADSTFYVDDVSLKEVDENDQVKIVVDNRPMQLSKPVIQIEGSYYAPMRDVFEAIDASYEWNSGNVKANKPGKSITIPIGNDHADAVPHAVLVGDTIMIPVRFACESLGVWVGWNYALNTIMINVASQVITRSERSPDVTHIGTVNRDMLEVVISDGKTIPSKMIPYKAEAGDEFVPLASKGFPDGTAGWTLKRKGIVIGYINGVKYKDIPPGTSFANIYQPGVREPDNIITYESIDGDPLNLLTAEVGEAYKIISEDGKVIIPKQVFRKTKPADQVKPNLGRIPVDHSLYLQLPQNLEIGKKYTLQMITLNTKNDKYEFTYQPEKMRSEMVHISQVGFRPDEPQKRAYLSAWLGDGGQYIYPDNLPFSIIKDENDQVVFTGKTKLTYKSSDSEIFRGGFRNFNKTYVYYADFNEFNKPGKYRVYVDGVGCSYPFEINENVWENAFKITMIGLYNQRSGIAKEVKYGGADLPRDFNPEDIGPIYMSSDNLLELGLTGQNDTNLGKHATPTAIPGAWGGYHDAGDWDRTMVHMLVPRNLLEVFQMCPDTLEKVESNIPKEHEKLPYVLNEALWLVDFYKRMQFPDGSTPGGVNLEIEPRAGEMSWTNTLIPYAYGPDVWNNYYYTTICAMAARLTQKYDLALAEQYRISAIKAMDWAEKTLPETQNKDWFLKANSGNKVRLMDERCSAAIELFRLTNDKKYMDIFNKNARFMNAQQGFNYASYEYEQFIISEYLMLSESDTDPAIRETAKKIMRAFGDACIDYQQKNAFNLTSWTPTMPVWYGFMGTAGASSLVRAHYQLGDKKYLGALVAANSYPTGGNAMNMSYTTGLGTRYMSHPLDLDTRLTGQHKIGVTAYGQFDMEEPLVGKDWWDWKWIIGSNINPPVTEWPTGEAFFDTYEDAIFSEFTVTQENAPNAFMWGYLAGRKVIQK